MTPPEDFREWARWWYGDMAFRPPEVLNAGYFEAMFESLYFEAVSGVSSTESLPEDDPAGERLDRRPSWLVS